MSALSVAPFPLRASMPYCDVRQPGVIHIRLMSRLLICRKRRGKWEVRFIARCGTVRAIGTSIDAALYCALDMIERIG